jgi:hypothetical protein
MISLVLIFIVLIFLGVVAFKYLNYNTPKTLPNVIEIEFESREEANRKRMQVKDNLLRNLGEKIYMKKRGSKWIVFCCPSAENRDRVKHILNSLKTLPEISYNI